MFFIGRRRGIFGCYDVDITAGCDVDVVIGNYIGSRDISILTTCQINAVAADIAAYIVVCSFGVIDIGCFTGEETDFFLVFFKYTFVMFRHGIQIDRTCCIGSNFALFAGNITGDDIDIAAALQADIASGRHTAALDFFVVGHYAVVVEAAAVPNFGILHFTVFDGLKLYAAAGFSCDAVRCRYMRAC